MKNGNGKSSLTLNLQDVYQDGLKDRVDITLKHTVLSDTRTIKNQNASKRLRIPDLDFTQGGVYNLTIFPTRYRPVGGFVKINEAQNTDETYMIPVDPEKITKVEFPAYADLPADLQELLTNSNAVENNEGKTGPDLYNAFDDTQRAGLLNIYWKMQHTTFADTKNVVGFVDTLTRVRGDRFFANIQKELRDETVNPRRISYSTTSRANCTRRRPGFNWPTATRPSITTEISSSRFSASRTPSSLLWTLTSTTLRGLSTGFR